jgi:nitrite reductase [NAD(P)H] small subunit
MKKMKTWVRIANCKDIPLREGRAVRIGNREIAIFNLGDRFLAVDNRCPHRGGPLADGIVSGSAVVCPLHAWKLSLETGEGVNSASLSSCVQTFPTKVENGIVFLELIENASHTPKQSGQDLPVICVEPGGVAAWNDMPLGG